MLGKMQKTIIEQEANKLDIPYEEAELMYLSYFKGVKEKFEEFDWENKSTHHNVAFKHIGYFQSKSIGQRIKKWKETTEK